MKTLRVIGIGAGHKQHPTLQAVAAMQDLDAVFLFDKGDAKDGLIALRKEICATHIRNPALRIVSAGSPDWCSDTTDYAATIDGLNRDKRSLLQALVETELAEGETAGLLVWGDPSLYDSTLRILGQIAADMGPAALCYEVVPGISSLQALTAAHKVPLNRIGGAVTITTGRRLKAGWPGGATDVAVMLDKDFAAPLYRGRTLSIFWGAYVGTDDEILIAGPLDDVADEIIARRSEARARIGWIMDSYLVKTPED